METIELCEEMKVYMAEMERIKQCRLSKVKVSIKAEIMEVERFEKDEVNDPLLETLALIDIVGENTNKSAFHANNSLLIGIGAVGPLYYKGLLIETIDVPDMGCEKFTYRIAQNCYIYGDGSVGKIMPRALVGAREKMDGVRHVVFVFAVSSGDVYSVHWDSEGIAVFQGNYGMCAIEQVKEQGYVTAGICNPTRKNELENIVKCVVSDHPFFFLSRDLVDNCGEGLVVLVDGREYKIPRTRNFTLKYREDDCSFVDRQGVVYPVEKVGDVRAGMCDVVYESGKYKFSRFRKDKEVPDSTQVIKVVCEDMVVIEDLYTLYVLPKTKLKRMIFRVWPTLGNVIQQYNIQKQGVVVGNKEIKGRVEKDFYSFDPTIMFNYDMFSSRDKDFVFLGGDIRMAYRLKDKEFFLNGSRLFSTQWTPFFRHLYIVKTRGICDTMPSMDIPGIGLSHFFFSNQFCMREGSKIGREIELIEMARKSPLEIYKLWKVFVVLYREDSIIGVSAFCLEPVMCDQRVIARLQEFGLFDRFRRKMKDYDWS